MICWMPSRPGMAAGDRSDAGVCRPLAPGIGNPWLTVPSAHRRCRRLPPGPEGPLQVQPVNFIHRDCQPRKNTSMKKKIIVIGSGFGGLSAAIRLARAGPRRDLVREAGQAGRPRLRLRDGRLQVRRRPDGHHRAVDVRRAVASWPASAARITSNSCSSTPSTASSITTGRYLDYNGDHEFILSQIEKFNPADKEGYSRFIATTKDMFDTRHGADRQALPAPQRHAQGGARSDPAASPTAASTATSSQVHQGRLPAPLLLLPPAADRRQPADALRRSTC